MEKKRAGPHQPSGMCEKVFNAFQPALRPLRRITLGQNQQHGPTNSGPTPHKKAPAKTDKLPEPVAPKHDVIIPEKKQVEHIKVLPVPSPPKAEVRPMGLPVPERVAPQAEKPTAAKMTAAVHEKRDEYVTRTKAKVQNAVAAVRKETAASKNK